MNRRLFRALLAVLAGTVLALVLLFLNTATSVRASPDTLCVNQTGSGCGPGCDGCYSCIQAAVNDALDYDGILIAGGVYADVGSVAVITRPLTIVGGYDTSCTNIDPDMYHTVLNAQGGGSVISITNAGDVLLLHLTLTDGDGTGNCGSDGCGGGIYAVNTALHVGHCVITDNVGSRSGGAKGGGIYLYSDHLDLWGSRIVSNTAAYSSSTSSEYGNGGGVFVQQGSASLWENEILNNVGSVCHGGTGGIHLNDLTQANVTTNTIRDNRANISTYWSSGGGLHIADSSAVYVAGNRIEDNWAAPLSGVGGGVYVYNSDVHLTANTIVSNTTGTVAGWGGGVCVFSTTPVTLSNNVIARSHAGSFGGGVWVGRSIAPPSRARLVNNTIVDNGDNGVMAEAYAILTMTNNIVAGHAVGLSVTNPSSVTISADTNLFWNTSDPITGSNGIREDPLLTGDYRLTAGSPAVDAGLTIPWLTVDLDGHTRPKDGVWDIGAFEGTRWEVFLPLVVRSFPQGGE